MGISMATFKSGLTGEQLRTIVNDDAIESLSPGTVKRNGKRLQACVSYKVDGKRKYFTHTLEGTISTGREATGKREAKTLLADWREDVIKDARIVAGITSDPTDTVRSCVESYIDERVSLGKIRQSTATYYRNAAKRIYRHRIGSMSMQDLTPSIVQAWVNELSKTLAGKTVKASFDVLDATCKKVLGRDHNPCRDSRREIELPKLSHNSKTRGSRPNALSFDGVARFNALLDEREANYSGIDAMSIGARLALHTGMRAEEVCGLRWRDVDSRSKAIHVRRVIERAEVPNKDESGETIKDARGNVTVTYTEFESQPKTDNSTRTIPLDNEVVEMLAKHRRTVSKMVRESYPDKDERPNVLDLYVLGGTDGSFLSPYKLGKRWGKFARSRNLLGTEGRTVTFHDLRHSAATRMLAAGIDVATVSHILGHAETSVTLNKYTTSDEKTKRAAVDRMADVFSMRTPTSGGNVYPFRAAN